MQDRSYRIRLAEPKDAEAITGFILRCYGSSYVEEALLDPSWVAAALAKGELIYGLASWGADHVGQVALRPQNAQWGLYQHCGAVVAPDHRGSGLMTHMSELVLRRATQLGAKLVVGRSVTSHLRTQRYNVGAGFHPLGLLLGLYPHQRVEGLPAAGGPVSALLVGLPLDPHPSPRSLSLVGQFQEKALQVLEGLRFPVTHRPLRRRLDSLRAHSTRHERTGLTHIRLDTEQGTLSPREAATRALDESARLVWVDVPAGHGEAPRAIAELRGLGFSYAAYVPYAGSRGEDVCRLQLCEETGLTRESMQLVPSARCLGEWVWAQAHSSVQVAV